MENTATSRDGGDTSLVWDKGGRIFVYLLFGLLPLWFLPFSSFPVAEAKLFLTGILVFGAFALWFAKTLATGHIAIPKSYVWIAGLVFLGASLLSLIFSSSTLTSFLGNVGQPDTFISFVLYLGALLIVPVFLRDLTHIMKAVLFFGGALGVLAVYSLLQFFGVFIIPLDFTQSTGFNPIGPPQALAVFMGAGLAFFVALLSSLHLSPILKAGFSAVAVLVGIVLVLVNFSYVWLGLLVAFALIVAWQIMHTRDKGQGLTRFNLPMFLIAVVAILFFVQPPITGIVQLPVSISPSLSSTFDIMKESYRGNIENAFIGSGPATFLYEYLQYRPLELNSTAFFGVRFSQGFSAISTFFVTMGVLGVVSILALLGYLLWQSMRGIALLGKAGSPYEKTAFVAFSALAFLVLMWFVYPVNFSIFLLTFLLGGILFASMRAGGVLPEWSLSFSTSPQRVFVLSFLAVILLTTSILGIYTHGQKYIAAVMHTRGVQAFNANQDVGTAVSRVNLALNLEDNDRYWRTMAQLMLVQANNILQDTTLDASTQRTAFEQALQGAIQAAQRATQANGADPLNWEQLAAVYSNVTVVVADASVFAIENYLLAAERNPKNPASRFAVGQTYVQAADNQQRIVANLRANEGSAVDITAAETKGAEFLSNALTELNTTLALKADYAPAHFLIAQVYERQGNRAGAIEKTVEVRNLNPQDVGVGYQLGLLYYFDDQLNAAEGEFNRVLLLNPNYSNARYFLGLIFDQQGKAAEAITQFEEVSILNPDNQEVKKIISNLENGLPALEGLTDPVTATEPPVPQEGDEEDLQEIEG